MGQGGRKLSYVATSQGNGNLLVGKAYTALLDLGPVDAFEIKSRIICKLCYRQTRAGNSSFYHKQHQNLGSRKCLSVT